MGSASIFKLYTRQGMPKTMPTSCIDTGIRRDTVRTEVIENIAQYRLVEFGQATDSTLIYDL